MYGIRDEEYQKLDSTADEALEGLLDLAEKDTFGWAQEIVYAQITLSKMGMNKAALLLSVAGMRYAAEMYQRRREKDGQ